MNCAEADELLGAYAVDALPADEAAAFRAHIAGCADHASRTAEMRALASSLASTVDPVPPPASLRSRLLDAVGREPQDSLAGTAPPRRKDTAASVGATGRSPGTPRRRAGPPGTPWRSVRPLQAWGALAAAIIAALIVWNVALQSGDGGDGRYAFSRASMTVPIRAHGQPGSGTAFYFEDDKRMLIVVSDVGYLEPTETYQMWAIADGQPSSIGFLEPNANGLASTLVPFDANTAQTFAVTIEPAGGSSQPTTDPILTAEVSS
jgi:anti-sigma-K factor RskA